VDVDELRERNRRKGGDDLPLPARYPDHRPGERLTGEVVDHLQQLAATGAMLEGAVDESPTQFRVVR
jgi:arginine/lysine/ornithine decarboxylase